MGSSSRSGFAVVVVVVVSGKGVVDVVVEVVVVVVVVVLVDVVVVVVVVVLVVVVVVGAYTRSMSGLTNSDWIVACFACGAYSRRGGFVYPSSCALLVLVGLTKDKEYPRDGFSLSGFR